MNEDVEIFLYKSDKTYYNKYFYLWCDEQKYFLKQIKFLPKIPFYKPTCNSPSPEQLYDKTAVIRNEPFLLETCICGNRLQEQCVANE